MNEQDRTMENVSGQVLGQTVAADSGMRTILCVDDEANILQALKRLLRKEGYVILTAGSGEEGLEVLRQNPQVQVVISDQRMPGMKGSEFLLKVKNEYPDMIRIILTGYSEASAIMEAITESEVSHFMTKPWDDDELKAIIVRCLAQYHLHLGNKLLLQKIQQQIQNLNVQVESDGTLPQLPQKVLDQLGVPVICINQHGLIDFCNESARKSAVLKQAFLGKSVYELVPKHIAVDIQAALDCSSSPICVERQWLPGENRHQAYITTLSIGKEVRGCLMLLMENKA